MRVDRRLPRAAIVLVAVLVAFVLTLPLTLPRGLRIRLAAALSERFDSQVELASLRVSILPRLRVAGEGVVLHFRGRADVPPLIIVKSFSAEASLFGLVGRPLRLTRVQLDGLEINVPPGGMDIDNGRKNRSQGDREEPPLVIDDLLSERAVLRILRRRPGKAPRVFEIHRLSMQDTGSNIPWRFRATLTNPTPPGQIVTHGTFGPWNAPRPSSTGLSGEYEFRDANLGVFDGIRGRLSSKGSFKGVLERIEVDGRAEVPRFALEGVGHPVALDTRFHSVVDGTSGNTWLKPVHAKFLQTSIRTSGGIVERAGEKGRTITLDVLIREGRIEDVLHLAAKARRPPMTGALKLTAKFVLPPGRADVIEKLRLDGSFEIDTARFTKGSVQARIDELSRKAQPGDDDEAENVASDFKGRFIMSGGVVRISNVSFSVPGARVDLDGSYTMRSEALDFRGTVRLDAKLSQMTTGAKSFFLKLVDPIFRRKNVTIIPITVGGTVDAPKVRLDMARAFTPK